MFCDHCGAENKPEATHCFACHQPLDRDSQSSANISSVSGPLLHNRYQILKQIGSGGFGAVYQAYDTGMHNRMVALKEIHSRGLTSEEQQEATASFHREVELLASLHHPGLPTIFEEFEEKQNHYLVMDFIEGETLEAYVARRGGKLPLSEVLEIALQLCDILEYLHTQQPPVIFRDLKPANVMRTAQGHLYLIDFGIARHFKPGQIKDTTAFGSPGYAAPEQYGRAQTTPRADIYSLGALLHFLLTGIDPSLTPFHFAPLPHTNQASTRPLNALIQRMTALNEPQRPTSVHEVETELKHIQDLQRQKSLSPGLAPAQPAPQSLGTQQAQTPKPARRRNLPKDQQQTQARRPSHGQLQVQVQEEPVSPESQPHPRKLTRRNLLIASALTLGGLALGGGTLLIVHRNEAENGPAPVEVSATYWSPDGNYVAFCWDNGKIGLLDAKSSRFLYTFNLYNVKDSIVDLLCWSPDSKRLALNYDVAQSAQIWDVESRKVILTYPASADGPIGLAFSTSETSLVWSPDGQYLAWGGANGVDIWSATSLNNAGVLNFADLGSQENTALVDALSWAGDSRRLAVSLSDSKTYDTTRIQIMDVKSQQRINSLTVPAGPNEAVLMEWAPVGDYIAVLKNTSLFLLHAVDAGKNINVSQTFEDVSALAWSTDGRFLALASYSGYWVYDMQRQQAFSYDSAQYVGLTWLPNGKIAIVSQTGQVQTLDVPL
ncbi:MAG TPA: protein kinase [Ktedonobacteraceae bacterium]